MTFIIVDVNLRNLYPDYYGHDEYIKISLETWDVFRESKRKDIAMDVARFRYKVYYSLDRDGGIIEYDAVDKVKTPEDIVRDMEETIKREHVFEALYQAIDKLPAKQKERITDYFINNIPVKEIALKDKVSIYSVYESIKDGLKNLKKLLKVNPLNEDF